MRILKDNEFVQEGDFAVNTSIDFNFLNKRDRRLVTNKRILGIMTVKEAKKFLFSEYYFVRDFSYFKEPFNLL